MHERLGSGPAQDTLLHLSGVHEHCLMRYEATGQNPRLCGLLEDVQERVGEDGGSPSSCSLMNTIAALNLRLPRPKVCLARG